MKKPKSFMIMRVKTSAVRANDSNAVGVYLVTTQADAKKTLAGHVPIELSHLLKELPGSR